MCFLFIWTAAVGPLWTLNMYFFIIIVKNVYRHALKCTVTFIHCENICENKRFTFIQFLCPQYFQPTARFPTTHTFVKYVASQLNITWPAQCTVHNAVHRVHKNLCNLDTFLIWIIWQLLCPLSFVYSTVAESNQSDHFNTPSPMLNRFWEWVVGTWQVPYSNALLLFDASSAQAVAAAVHNCTIFLCFLDAGNIDDQCKGKCKGKFKGKDNLSG